VVLVFKQGILIDLISMFVDPIDMTNPLNKVKNNKEIPAANATKNSTVSTL